MIAEVYVIGTGMTAFGKSPGRSITSLVDEAVREALDDADVDGADIGLVTVGNAVSSLITGQAMIQGQLALLDSSVAGAPVVNVENACASGATAFQLAVTAVLAGQCEHALAIGVEKMTHPDKHRAFEALATAVDVSNPRVASPSGGRRSLFMDLYARAARAYLDRTGAPHDVFSHVASTSHLHGSLNPLAQYKQPHTPEQVQASRVIVDPLTLLMCSPIGDGAAALVVSRRPRRDAGIRVRGMALRSGRRGEGGELVRRTAEAAFGQAGISGEDLDMVELHDAAAPATLSAIEEMGLTERGSAWRLAMDGSLRYDGSLPVNTSGGLLARGHPVGATGAAQLVELANQLRGRAGARQVANPRLAAAQNAGGAVDVGESYTPAVCAVTVLERT